MAIIYRTTGPWGAGAEINLTAAQVDGNFHHLSSRMTGLEGNPPDPVSIVNITSSGGTMSVHLSDGSIVGPLRLPTASFYVHGPWQPGLAYALNDVFHHDNATYIVRVAHTSNPTFDPGRTSGGESVYQVMTYGFEFRGPWQPGTAYRAYDLFSHGGDVFIVRLEHTSGVTFDPDAENGNGDRLCDRIFAQYVAPPRDVTIGAAVSGRPANSQVILIPITRALTLAVNATGSQASAAVAATAQTDITIGRNGSSFGTVRFAAAGTTASFVGVAETAFAAGDRLSFVFPATADVTLADVGIALRFMEG